MLENFHYLQRPRPVTPLDPVYGSNLAHMWINDFNLSTHFFIDEIEHRSSFTLGANTSISPGFQTPLGTSYIFYYYGMNPGANFKQPQQISPPVGTVAVQFGCILNLITGTIVGTPPEVDFQIFVGGGQYLYFGGGWGDAVGDNHYMFMSNSNFSDIIQKNNVGSGFHTLVGEVRSTGEYRLYVDGVFVNRILHPVTPVANIINAVNYMPNFFGSDITTTEGMGAMFIAFSNNDFPLDTTAIAASNALQSMINQLQAQATFSASGGLLTTPTGFDATSVSVSVLTALSAAPVGSGAVSDSMAATGGLAASVVGSGAVSCVITATSALSAPVQGTGNILDVMAAVSGLSAALHGNIPAADTMSASSGFSASGFLAILTSSTIAVTAALVANSSGLGSVADTMSSAFALSASVVGKITAAAVIQAQAGFVAGPFLSVPAAATFSALSGVSFGLAATISATDTMVASTAFLATGTAPSFIADTMRASTALVAGAIGAGHPTAIMSAVTSAVFGGLVRLPYVIVISDVDVGASIFRDVDNE